MSLQLIVAWRYEWCGCPVQSAVELFSGNLNSTVFFLMHCGHAPSMVSLRRGSMGQQNYNVKRSRFCRFERVAGWFWQSQSFKWMIRLMGNIQLPRFSPSCVWWKAFWLQHGILMKLHRNIEDLVQSISILVIVSRVKSNLRNFKEKVEIGSRSFHKLDGT